MENKKTKMLIVDDAPINRSILSEMFSGYYDITECADGSEAIQAVEEYRDELAVILLDILMPKCDGFEVLEYMKGQQIDDIPVILISSYVTDENIRKAYDYDVADCIQRPFEEKVVLQRVLCIVNHYKKKDDWQMEDNK